ncbi:MAG: class III extradiol ring-cleavage dioxygenase [Actinomycetota bacterium]|nr:class III extradiol ring-cleavage dioxygenase [Actinomycetota bacterium]
MTVPSTRDRMPALYLGHGAPPLLDDPLWTAELSAWAAGLPRPEAILIVSAHWESAPMTLSSPDAGTPLVYDFSGFDPRYFAVTYPTPDATALAELVASVLPASEPLHQHPRRGLDHGAWVPLKVMYPVGDIPVLQLSLPSMDPLRLLEIGRALQPLRDHGVLIIGSGYLTHGLPFLRDWRPEAAPPGWSRDFDAWAAEALDRGDVDALAGYRDMAPGMPYAHPTVEHYVPLFITLGAATDPGRPPATVIDGYFFGLSKRSIQVA